MANVNTINLGGLSNADLQAQQLALQRKQAIADAIRKSAMTPIEQQVAAGRVVPISPWQGLSKLGQAWIANKSDEANQEKQAALGTEAAKRSAAALRAMAPPGVFDNSSTQSAPYNGPMAAPQQPQVPDPVKQGWIRALSVYQTDPELGKKLIENMAELTTEQKNMAATDQDPRLMGALAQAKARKEGIIEYQPGTTAQDLATGQERFQPTLAPGINLQNGVASAIPGFSNAQGQIAGAQTSATEAAKQPFQPPTPVQTANGPMLMTPAQQIAAANGQVPRGTPPAAPQGQPQGAPGQLPGLPLQTPTQAALDAAKVPAVVEAAKVKTAAQPLYAAIEDAKKLVDKLPHGATANAEAWASNQHLIGNPEKAAAVAQWNNIMGNFTMQGIASSGLGRMDIPIVNAINKASQVPMDAAPAAKKAALDEIKALLDRHVASTQNVVGELNQPGTTADTSVRPMAPVENTPSIDDLLKKYGPK